MFTVTRPTQDTREIASSGRIVLVFAIFFVVLGVLDIALGMFAAHPGDVLVPGIACLVVGIVYGFVPYRVTLKIDVALGELTRVSKSLFSGSDVTEKLGELECVTIQVSTYAWSFVARRKNGGSVPLFRRLKTWTFQQVPPPPVVQGATELAEALGLPYRAPA